MPITHPNLYQINTRVLLSRLSTKKKRATLKDIPKSYWKWLKTRKMDYIWLMGVWNTNEHGPDTPRQDWELTKYQSVLPDFNDDDLRGSPYAIDQYVVDPQMGTQKDLLKLKKQLNSIGIKLILDFVPNHFGAQSSLIEKHPELFLQGNEERLEAHPDIFFKHSSGLIFAHGKDPNFAPWMDTIQVDYSSAEARSIMEKMLVEVSQYCDGLRCDMSMLIQKHVFQRTWGNFLHHEHMHAWDEAFWLSATSAVRQQNQDFIFIAEVYWGMEQEMQDHGFNYTYDKALLDQMIERNINAMGSHLDANAEYQTRSVRFLENHDEARIATVMSRDQHYASAMLMSHLPGLRFYHMGQWEGRQVQLPVQLRRAPNEPACTCGLSQRLPVPEVPKKVREIIQPVCLCTWHFYETLLHNSTNIVRRGSWRRHFIQPSWGPSESLLSYLWTLDRKVRLVMINYSHEKSVGVIDTSMFSHDLTSGRNLLSGQKYNFRSGKVSIDFHLSPWGYEIIEFNIKSS